MIMQGEERVPGSGANQPNNCLGRPHQAQLELMQATVAEADGAASSITSISLIASFNDMTMDDMDGLHSAHRSTSTVSSIP